MFESHGWVGSRMN